eukprot:4713228-Alexandrium_andersonii.AAC.1
MGGGCRFVSRVVSVWLFTVSGVRVPGCSLCLGCSRPARRGTHANTQPNGLCARCSQCTAVSGVASLALWQ